MNAAAQEPLADFWGSVQLAEKAGYETDTIVEASATIPTKFQRMSAGLLFEEA